MGPDLGLYSCYRTTMAHLFTNALTISVATDFAAGGGGAEWKHGTSLLPRRHTVLEHG